MSNLPHLYRELPERMRPFVFGDVFTTPIVPAKHGDSSGVFGAARLWDADGRRVTPCQRYAAIA